MRTKLHDPRRPVAERVADALAKMTVDEKVSQMVYRSPAIPRLGIPEYNWWNECLHGVARAGRATVFPQAIGLAASFDTALVRSVASAIGDEARAKHHAALRAGNRGQYRGLTFWTPNINIFRDPRWGRGQETWGEDPFLTGTLGSAFVRGLQGTDRRYLKIAACAKHFAVHSGPEKDRHRFDAVVGTRDLHETYLRAFRMLVDAGVESVMGAYNRTNGEACCASRTLLTQILREQWGFGGHVVSDCGAIGDIFEHHKVVPTAAEAAAIAVRNGCDLECGAVYAYLGEALEKGLIAEVDIDRALGRLLTTRVKLGMFDPDSRVPWSRLPESCIDSPAHRALARTAAAESIVLLKNDGGFLPIRPNVKSIFVVGPSAASVDVLLGNYNGMTSPMVTALEGIVASAGQGTTVEYKLGILPDRPNDNPVDWTTGCARDAALTIAVMGISPADEGEEGDAIANPNLGDRSQVELPAHQVEYLRKLAGTGTPMVVVLSGGCAISVPEVAEFASAILLMWYPGEEGGNALADVLFGRTCPTGRLPVTIVKRTTDLPDFDNYSMTGRTYRFMDTEPLYRFGFGLSYTSFRYGTPRLSRKSIGKTESVTLSVDVTNAGRCEAAEVVQMYVRDLEASVPVPHLHLEGFSRVMLKPGQKKTVTFTIGTDNLCAYSDNGEPFVEPGEFEISVGGCQPTDSSFRGKKVRLAVKG